MNKTNTLSGGLTANCPFKCDWCGSRGIDTSAHPSRYAGICVNCEGKVIVD